MVHCLVKYIELRINVQNKRELLNKRILERVGLLKCIVLLSILKS